MSETICRICLRTDIKTRNIVEELFDFHDEITDYSVYESAKLQYCTICEHLLRKFFKFNRKCRLANKILKGYKIDKSRLFPSNLHERLPPTSISIHHPQGLYTFEHDSIKEEKENKFDNSEPNEYPIFEHNYFTIKIEQINSNDLNEDNSECHEGSDEPIFKNVKTPPFENTIQSDNNLMQVRHEQERMDQSNISTLSEKDLIKCQSQPVASETSNQGSKQLQNEIKFLEINPIRVVADNVMCNTEIRNEAKEIISVTRKRVRLPVKGKPRSQLSRDFKKFEKVFDIKRFATMQEAKDELELRKTSEWYLSAEHKCEICYMVFRSDKYVEYHMRWHDSSAGEHVCEICQMRFATRKIYRAHRTRAHVGKFTCKMCPMITYQHSAALTHFQMHEGVKFTCEICSHTCRHLTSFLNHQRTAHENAHICVTCARTFKTKNGLNGHIKMMHKTESLTDSDATAHCEPCGLTFANEQVYTVHVLNTQLHQQLASSIIGCKKCGVRFEDVDSLRTHKKTHGQQIKTTVSISQMKEKLRHQILPTPGKNNKMSYSCNLCGTKGPSLRWGRWHMSEQHPDSEYSRDLEQRKQYMCDVCGKCYTTVHILRDHMNIHTGLKPFACRICPARFTSNAQLVVHVDWHKPAKRECAVCEKKFVTASGLRNHMRSHTKDRRYKCSACPKGFYFPALLREHIRGVHNQERRARKPRTTENLS